MTTTTEPDYLAEGLAQLRNQANAIFIPFNSTPIFPLSRRQADAVLREFDGSSEDIGNLSERVVALDQRVEFLHSKLTAARATIANLTAVNDNLAAEKEQHAEEAADDAEVAGIIAGHLHAELEKLEIEVGVLYVAVDFYRQLAIDGVRINRATDAAFLTALELDL